MGCNSTKQQGAKNASPAASASGGKDAKGQTAKDQNGNSNKPKPNADGPRTVLGKYRLAGGKDDIMGKGTSSICRKGIEIATGRSVAIKLYKEQQSGGKVKDTTMQKFKRQIEVLKELMEPFPQPQDKTLWSPVLASIQPSQVFMQLIDYSKDESGEPGPDPRDGFLYVVTELAQYSLKDFLADRREKQKSLSKEAVRDLSKRMVLAMAALHAKGFVHIDMKPENMMVFDGRLKVIDVDGCVRINTRVSINDGSISFSPCYCAPEWARFMIKDDVQTITATPALDVWSVGMTLCELVTLDAIWKPQYANFMRNAHSHREAGFLFLEWLGDIKKPPLPRIVERFDDGLLELLTSWLLVCSPKNRKSCAQALSFPYLNDGGWAKYGPGDPSKSGSKEDENTKGTGLTGENVNRTQLNKVDRVQDDCLAVPIKQGTLFKLNSNGNPKEASHWIMRDMWLARNHSLCYYSVKESKRLVLIDGEKFIKADITRVYGMAKEFAIEVKSKADVEEKMETVILGCPSEEELDDWMSAFTNMADMDMNVSFHLGDKMAEDVKAFKLAVRNRRMKVEGDKDAFEPAYKAKLWKLKAGGDRSKEEDWFLRDMWIAKNGSLVYYSPKEERELVYYTASDIARAKVTVMKDGEACRSNVFSIQLAPSDGVEFEPGEFASESASARDKWIAELSKFM